ncbi:pyridoxamine 5'-phosphate oxidase family protein [Aerophototrophica crusticola]|uniref:pyridoxamine 5'-phosphate oxidase family protein n=1 Tax=Aerophototrophica crusticola TaxID=1709002 RepID=UPI00384ED98A
MTVASLRQDGSPTARTVVLRGVQPADRILRFHTDRRAPKLAGLAAEPRVGLLLYDPGARLQLRLDGVAEVVGEGGLPDRLWDRSHPGSRACYRQPVAPGASVDGPRVAIPPAGEPAHGRENFAIVQVRVHRLDWLFLNADGHRRACFDFSPAGEGPSPEGHGGQGIAAGWTGRWVAP